MSIKKQNPKTKIISPKKKKLNWLPKGCSIITPYLVVEDVEKSYKFYKKAFGFEGGLMLRYNDKTNKEFHKKAYHAELTYMNSTISIGVLVPEKNFLPPNKLNGNAVNIYVYAPNVDEFFKKAKKNGAVSLVEPTDEFWVDRVCVLQDIDVHQWLFATHIKDII